MDRTPSQTARSKLV